MLAQVYAERMAEPGRRERMSYADYLAAEVRSETKHEYLDGEVHAMAGGTPEHAALAMALGASLVRALEGRPCRVFSSDLRLRIRETKLSTYPDLTVVCGTLEVDEEDPNAALNPVVVVEVLSETTAAYDRGAKAAHYRRIPSLREYVLVAQDEQRIEVHRRNAAGVFEIHEFGPGEDVELASIGARFPVSPIYANPLGGGPASAP
jgi:Uma2 family endonuclease